MILRGLKKYEIISGKLKRKCEDHAGGKHIWVPCKDEGKHYCKNPSTPNKKTHKNQKAWGGIVQNPSSVGIKTLRNKQSYEKSFEVQSCVFHKLRDAEHVKLKYPFHNVFVYVMQPAGC